MLLRRCLLIICGLLVVIWPSKAEKDKLWEKDMSHEVYIEASVEGLKGKIWYHFPRYHRDFFILNTLFSNASKYVLSTYP